MFRPVGDLPPSVYWRRRLALAASVLVILVLAILTARTFTSGGSPAAASGSRGSTTTPTHGGSPGSTSHRPSHAGSQSSPATASKSTSRSSRGSKPASSSAPPSKCTSSQLALSAASDRSSYAVGDSPVLSIVVQNTSAAACVQDLADPQVMLRVYNGESRVWGSHDCKIEPGTDDRTLMPGAAVRVSIVWSGLSSQPNDCANRQRAGAGTYTLYASLSGKEGKAAQFTIR